jgi:hypothetical protein
MHCHRGRGFRVVCLITEGEREVIKRDFNRALEYLDLLEDAYQRKSGRRPALIREAFTLAATVA